jgi:hypothetical protein
MKNKSESFRDLSIDEIISILAEVRVELDELRKIVPIQEVKEFLEENINKIDVIGCELTQNIAKKLKEK